MRQHRLMGWSELSKVNLKDPDNVVLFYRRRNPVLWALIVGAVVAFMVGAAMWLINPDARAGHGKGAWLAALFLLLPVVLRGVLWAILCGYVMEWFYRRTQLVYDKVPDLVIGPTGIAVLNPWRPRALRWQELKHVRRYVASRTFSSTPELIGICFSADAEPEWMPRWLWLNLPRRWFERGITIMPKYFGLTEAELMTTVERFAGKVTVTQRWI